MIPESVIKLAEFRYLHSNVEILPAYFSLKVKEEELMVAVGYICYPNGRITGYRVILTISNYLPAYEKLSNEHRAQVQNLAPFKKHIPDGISVWVKG